MQPPRRSSGVLAVSVASVLAGLGVASDGLPPIGPEPTRADLAAAYLQVDAAASHLLAGDSGAATIAEANRRFDRATMQFFAGRPSDVIVSLAELTEWMESQSLLDEERQWWASTHAARKLLAALRLNALPAVAIVGEPLPTVSISRLTGTVAPDPGHAATLLVSAIAPGTGQRTQVARWELPAGDETDWTIGMAAILDGDAALGRWQFEATIVDGEMVPLAGPRAIGTVSVVAERPSAVRSALSERLARLDSSDPTLRQAFASFRGRLELLADEPSTTASAQFLADPHALAEILRWEIERIESGANPYAERAGDLWRVFEAGDPSAPVRIPARVIVPDDLRPGAMLIVALHGAGGDENMFPDGYGAGAITRLAADFGAALVSPATTAVAVAPAMLSTIVETMIVERGIDPERVVILGHSMGAAAAMRAVDALPGTFRAWAAIGGSGRVPQESDAAGLIVLGALDPLANPARLMPTLKPQTDGAGVEIDVRDGMGHTLLVGAVLPDTIGWLAARSTSRVDAPAGTPPREP